MDPYSILQISPTAGHDEIRAAYRNLARRWHPDRFMEGPERDWANEKMADINAAYSFCMRNPAERAASSEAEEQAELKKIGDMVSGGDYFKARKSLMALRGRGAEWNYLLGMILLRTQEAEKARIYLSIACHQQPENIRYIEALRSADRARHTSLLNTLKKRFSR